MSQIIDVTLTGPGNFRKTVKALELGPFSIFQTQLKWNVTHTPTGRCCYNKACCVFQAIAIAEAIAGVIDWAQPEEALNVAGKAAGIKEIVAGVKCPAPNQHEGANTV